MSLILICSVGLQRAFQYLSRKVHPDKNHDPRANQAMQKVNEAYECLKDDTKRLAYDFDERTRHETQRRREAENDIGMDQDLALTLT